MALLVKHMLGLEQVEREDIETILDTAASLQEISYRPVKKVPTLRGKTQVNLFFEPSTRTRTSFEIAGKRLSADVVNFTASASSLSKGETLADTARNLWAMRPDILVVRHSAAGAPHLLAKLLDTPIINAGDGAHEHPTQALLDLFTVREKKRKIGGLKVVIAGDIAHSRVARSNIYGFSKMGAEVWVVGPPTLIPPGIERMGARVSYRLEQAIPDADVIMMLRIQLERGAGSLFPSLREYAIRFGLNSARMRLCKPDVLVMHPGPINRGVEISPEVADGPYSVILDQVEAGVAVRMALLYLLCAGAEHEDTDQGRT
jgi:aspartate carbamoyltransferase catalytic subunit